ncbi:MAG: toll/interleukin-1 receptor domain-containing protein [Lewinellaceae bacterium]|nr:toll/interleukin-1 receptor domain-containing protein [Lewinellaceae bacterium]
MNKIPRVFISYSHDSLSHKKWVLEFATRLRNNGIDAIIDQWELKAGDDIPHFMETNLEQADYVLMVCTPNYVQKANAGTGGVGYEKMIITSGLLSSIDQNKVIPIVREKGNPLVPTFLKSKLYLDFSIPNNYEFNFDELIRTVHQAPVFKKPEVGNNPFVEQSEFREVRNNSGLLEVMGAIVRRYESHFSYGWESQEALFKMLNISRIYFESIIKEAREDKLIEAAISTEGKPIYRLTEDGKNYAIENGLINYNKDKS